MADESETNEAPIYFHNTVSCDDSAALTVAIERCPLCRGCVKPFYCQVCVSDGCFQHSEKRKCSQSYHQKQQRWKKRKSERERLLKKFNDLVIKKEKPYDKINEIEECKQRILLLKRAILKVKKDTEKYEDCVKRTKERNVQKKSKKERHNEKISKVQQYITHRGQISLQRKDESETVLIKLQRERKLHLDVLLQYIFTISEIQPSQSDSLLGSSSTARAIKDACQTAYVEGQWQYNSDFRGDVIYKILEPSLPSNGNYSAYNSWVCMRRENSLPPEQESGGDNTGHMFQAALCYSTQLLSILLHILDINNPRKLCYSDFCSDELSEKQLNNAVNKLNHNVLYLCFAQGMRKESLSTKDTLHNLYMLVQSPNIGSRCLAFEVSEEMLESILDGSISDDSDDDHDNVTEDIDIGLDWEVTDDVPELSSNLSSNDNAHVTSASETGGLLASATTSIASFWMAAKSTFERR